LNSNWFDYHVTATATAATTATTAYSVCEHIMLGTSGLGSVGRLGISVFLFSGAFYLSGS
jgi:hypothetical protein